MRDSRPPNCCDARWLMGSRSGYPSPSMLAEEVVALTDRPPQGPAAPCRGRRPLESLAIRSAFARMFDGSGISAVELPIDK